MFSSNTSQVADGGYQISRSLRFNSADTANLSCSFTNTATNARLMTLSLWVKRCRPGDYDGVFSASNGIDQLRFENNDRLAVYFNEGTDGTVITTQVFRDPSSWYHIVVAIDTTQATASNRFKLYINGTQVTAFSTANYPTLNYNLQFNTTSHQRIGIGNNTVLPMAGYMTEIYRIDGQQLTPSSFGETNAQTGVWQPKAYSGSYGTNGFYLNFSDNSNTTAATLGKDYSGNGNNWTPNNFSVTSGAGNDSLVDTPTPYGSDSGAGGEVRGNYATLNPLNATPSPSISNGNLYQVSTTSGHMNGSASTIAMSSGKWYAEVVFTRVAGSTDSYQVGLADAAWQAERLDAGGWYGRFWYFSTGYAYVDNGNKNTSNSASSYGASYTQGDVIGIAFDADAGTLTFYKNGTSQGTAFTGITGAKVFAASCYKDASITLAFDINFGQRPFAYTAPSGFKALCTQNLPTPAIGATTATQAGKYFNPVIWTATGSSQAVTGVGFTPDFVWWKERSGVRDHALMDQVRGGNKYLVSNATAAEQTYNMITSWDSDGFTAGSGALVNGATEVAWNWKANGAGSSNTAGSITSTVSANTTSGFSIVTYTGTGANATIGHGLGAAPRMIIVKRRNGVDIWPVYHESIGNTQYLRLQGDNPAGTFNVWQNTSPTSSVFYISTDSTVNTNTGTYVAYCFAPIAGFSAFGSYTGNGSSAGPFVFTGFKPAFVLIKRTDDIQNWFLLDNKRNPANAVDNYLMANSSDAAANFVPSQIDFLSNGFKLLGTAAGLNASGGNYIYMAVAENPFKYSLAR